jgi:hypothetical protein
LLSSFIAYVCSAKMAKYQISEARRIGKSELARGVADWEIAGFGNLRCTRTSTAAHGGPDAAVAVSSCDL